MASSKECTVSSVTGYTPVQQKLPRGRKVFPLTPGTMDKTRAAALESFLGIFSETHPEAC